MTGGVDGHGVDYRHDHAVTVLVNGAAHTADVHAETTVLELLRDRLGRTGTKKGCALGHCGACTVLLDGRRVNSCLVLAVAADGATLTTVEGLSDSDVLDPVQAAFLDHDALQCGYCTPGQIISAHACIAEGHTGSAEQIREWMSGNLCRCGAYANIVAAVRQATGAGG